MDDLKPLGVSITTFKLPVFRSNGLSFLSNFIRGNNQAQRRPDETCFPSRKRLAKQITAQIQDPDVMCSRATRRSGTKSEVEFPEAKEECTLWRPLV
jgi:hypothetical protein